MPKEFYKFKYEIGDVVNNCEIINKKLIKDLNGKLWKKYKIKCNNCGFDSGGHYVNKEYKEEYWATEYYIKCPCCCSPSRITVTEINSIWKTEPWMIDMGIDEEIAKTISKGHNGEVNVKCRYCGKINKIKCSNLYTRRNCPCTCIVSNISYPERLMIEVLKDLNIEFIFQLSKSTFEWCENKLYDFYIPSFNTIIEMHGRQHYEYTGFSRTLEEEQSNDRLKKEIAISNGIDKYVVIDCYTSDLEYIRSNIIKSELSNIFNLNCVNWEKCNKSSLSDLVEEVCNYWNNKEDWETTSDLAKIFHINRHTIVEYLKFGNKYGLCKYNGKEELKKHCYKYRSTFSIYKGDEFIMNFTGLKLLEDKSEELLGVKLFSGGISDVINGKRDMYKGFKFIKAPK